MSLLGLVYLPDEHYSRECEGFASRLALNAQPKSILREDALAHISIAHVLDVKDRDGAWAQSVDALPAKLTVNMANLYFGFSSTSYNGNGSANPCVDAGVAVVNQSDIAGAHAACLDLQWLRDGVRRSSDASRFFPHLTLGVFGCMPTEVDLKSPILGVNGVECRLAMGPIGEHGVFQRIDYIAGDEQ